MASRIYLATGIFVIILALLYCPPWYNAEMCRNYSNYIVDCFDELSRRYTNPCFLIVGDFNSLDCSFFHKRLHLKQLVTEPTRGDRILDKIFTNYGRFFCTPYTSAPIGKSDHRCVFLRPLFRNLAPADRKVIYRRDLSDSVVDQIGFDLVHVNWSNMFLLNDVQTQADFFMMLCTLLLINMLQSKSILLSRVTNPGSRLNLKS